MQCDAFQSYKYFAVDKKNKAKSRKQTCSVPCCVHTFAANAPASRKRKGVVQQVIFNKKSSQQRNEFIKWRASLWNWLTFACASQYLERQAANSKALWSQKRAGSHRCTLYMAKSRYQWMLGGIPDIPWKHGDQNKSETEVIHVEWVNYDLTALNSSITIFFFFFRFKSKAIHSINSTNRDSVASFLGPQVLFLISYRSVLLRRPHHMSTYITNHTSHLWRSHLQKECVREFTASPDVPMLQREIVKEEEKEEKLECLPLQRKVQVCNNVKWINFALSWRLMRLQHMFTQLFLRC